MKERVVPTSVVMESSLFSIPSSQGGVTALLSHIIPLTALYGSSSSHALLQDMVFGQRANCGLFNTSHLPCVPVSLFLSLALSCSLLPPLSFLAIDLYIRNTQICWVFWPFLICLMNIYYTIITVLFLGDVCSGRLNKSRHVALLKCALKRQI